MVSNDTKYNTFRRTVLPENTPFRLMLKPEKGHNDIPVSLPPFQVVWIFRIPHPSYLFHFFHSVIEHTSYSSTSEFITVTL